jgi:MFS family permease
MVDQPDDLANAIALNSSMVHSSRLVGPALAGYLIYAFGEGYCFLIDGFSYVAVLVALALMRLERRPRATVTARPLAAFLEGTRYAFGFAPIRTLLLMVAVTSLAAMSQMTLMPVFAGTVLGGGERTLGWLLGASGLGAVVGSLFLAARKSVLGLGRVIAMACALLGVALVAFSVTRFLPLALGLLVVAGFALVTQMAASNTVLQTIVDEEKRGRVMALYSMAFLGVAPIGSLIGGGVATLAGAPVALVISGAVCLVTAALFAWQLPKMRPLVQPIYRSRGILPEIATGMESTEAIAPAQE